MSQVPLPPSASPDVTTYLHSAGVYAVDAEGVEAGVLVPLVDAAYGPSVARASDGIVGVTSAMCAWAWMAGVTAEMVYAHVVARSTIAEHLTGDDPDAEPLTYGAVHIFLHWLAAASE